MKKFFSTLLATLFLSLFLIQTQVSASGKMEVKLGERVDFVAEGRQVGLQYRWTVNFGKEIVATQSSPNFSHIFNRQGEYVINLTATIDSRDVESTTIRVLAGDLYSQPTTPVADGQQVPVGRVPLRINLETLPAQLDDGRVEMLGDGTVRYDLSLSSGDIIEYRIDQNIFVDSDGNGTANDDIDNENHGSYLTGEPYLAVYDLEESARIAAEITLVDKEGNRSKEQVEVVASSPNTTGDPVAVLDVAPAPDEENTVRLYNDPHTVAFYSRRSSGDIIEYRIDRNIFEDSDQDGDPANDIDNADDPSFKTGDVWETTYDKTDQQIIAQLIAVGSGGKGSRVQRALMFGDKPPVIIPISDTVEPGVIRLTADKDIVKIGDPIRFEVVGLQLGLDQYLFEWDFDGDDEVDKEVEGLNTVEHIFDEPGVIEAKVRISDLAGNTADRTLQVTARDRVDTNANFEFSVTGNSVSFTNLSTAADELADQRLRYNWSFGDTDETSFEAQRVQTGSENPTYTYNRAGTYIVTLTITDSNDVVSESTSEVIIEADAAPVADTPDQPADEGEPSGDGSIFVRLLKIALYLIIIVVALILFVVGGLLAFTKVQHPDLTFEELVDELKAKVLTKMGVHEEGVQPATDLPKATIPETPEKPEAVLPKKPEEPAPAEPEAPVADTTAAPDSEAPKGPVPDWLKDKQVIEGEVEEEVPAEPAPTPAPEAPAEPEKPEAPAEPSAPEAPKSDEEKGPTPDWLKNA